MNRIEREYQNALDELRFSQEAKERMMNNLMNQKEQAPVRQRNFRPLRTGLIAAAVCAALLGTAGAANMIARQTKTYFLENKQDVQRVIESEIANNSDKGAPVAVGIHGGFNSEYDYRSTADGTEEWWNAYGLTPLEETVGTEEDGWTRMRKFQREGFLEQRYLAETLSGFNSLWTDTHWDTTWVEERYTSVPNGQTGYIKIRDGIMAKFSLSGEFQGEDGAAFKMDFSRGDRPHGDSDYRMTTGYDHVEVYQTLDGVEVSIEMGTSNSGKSVFWADFTSGCNYFGMVGTEVELDELHAILDSLDLSNLLEYRPVK